MNKPSVFVFDIDDTLFLEKEYVRSGFSHVDQWLKKEKNIDHFFQAAWKAYQAGVRGEVFDQALRSLGQRPNPEIVSVMVNEYRTHQPEISLLKDAEFLLSRLQSANKELAIISDGPLVSQANKVKSLKISHLFRKVILTDHYGKDFWKPHPRAFLEVEDFFSFQGRDLIYIGDNPRKDFFVPNQRGWETIQVKREAGQYGDIDGLDDAFCPRMVVNSLEEIVDIYSI